MAKRVNVWEGFCLRVLQNQHPCGSLRVSGHASVRYDVSPNLCCLGYMLPLVPSGPYPSDEGPSPRNRTQAQPHMQKQIGSTWLAVESKII